MKTKGKGKHLNAAQPTLYPKPESGIRFPKAKVSGDELPEAFLVAGSSKSRRMDLLLLRAKREAAHARATHFSNSELRAVSWFAHLPEFPSELAQTVFDERNFLASCFWAVWRRDPATVLRLTKMIREQPQDTKQLRLEVESIVAKRRKLPKLDAENYEKIKARVKRARKQLKPPKNVAKFAASISSIGSK